MLRILASSGLAASVAGGLWLGLAHAWIAALTATAMFAPAADRYDQQMPFLFAVGVLLFLLALAVHYVLLAFEAARRPSAVSSSSRSSRAMPSCGRCARRSIRISSTTASTRSAR